MQAGKAFTAISISFTAIAWDISVEVFFNLFEKGRGEFILLRRRIFRTRSNL